LLYISHYVHCQTFVFSSHFLANLLLEHLIISLDTEGICACHCNNLISITFPHSAPALSSKASTKPPVRTTSDDVTSRSAWKAYTNGDLSQKVDFDDNSGFGVAAPFLKSFMQVPTVNYQCYQNETGMNVFSMKFWLEHLGSWFGWL